jgi:hypothetical protein
MGTRAVLAGALSAVVLSGAPAAAAKPITHGIIKVGRGASGAALGMTRQQLIDVLGHPVAENQNGVLSFARDPTIFDIYLKLTGHAQQFVIAGGDFKLSDGNAIFARGGLRRLSNHYGGRLKFHRFDDGSPYYEIVTRFHGRKVLNDFPTTRKGLGARVLDVFIVFA